MVSSPPFAGAIGTGHSATRGNEREEMGGRRWEGGDGRVCNGGVFTLKDVCAMPSASLLGTLGGDVQ